MRESDQAKLVEALAFALAAHGDQKRKGTEIPYVSHLLQVAGLVLEHGGDAEQATAALLHDTLEDAHVELATLREKFGARVAAVVKSLTDVLEGDTPEHKSPWSERKRRYIEHLAEADGDALLVAACDKLHNLRAILADLEHAARERGPEQATEALAKFTGSPRQIRWYYETVIDALGDDIPPRLRAELRLLAAELARFVPEVSPRP